VTLRSGEGHQTDAPDVRPTSALHALLFDRYADAVLVTDEDGRYIEANLAAATLLGYSRADLLGLAVTDISASEQTEAGFVRLGTEGYWRGDVDLRRKDGSPIRVEARVTTLETRDGRWGVAILRESGEPLREALRATEAQLAAIVESSYDAIYSETADGTILTWNKGAERLYGYTAEEAIGRHVSFTAPPERSDEIQHNLKRIQSGERIRDYETIRLRKDGTRVEVSLSISPVRDHEGAITGIAAIARDVTERRASEHRTNVLYRLTTAVGHARTEREVFDAALDALQRAIHTDRAAVLLLDDEGVMRFRAWRGLSAAYRRAVEGHSPWRRGETDPRPIHVPDVETDPALRELRDTILGEGIRALSFVPLVHQGELFGKSMLYFDAPRSLTPIDLQLATSIADQVAFSLARLRAERALEHARTQLELITFSSADGLTIQAADGSLVYANLAAARLSGCETVGEFLRDTPKYTERWEMFDEHGNPVEPAQLPGRRAILGEENPEALLRVRDRETGAEYWRQIRATPATDEEGKILYAVNLFHDVTAERRAQEQLRFQAALLSAQAEASIEGILVVSPDGRMVSWNRRFAEMWEISEDVLASRSDQLAISAVLSKLVDPDAFRRRITELYADPTAEASDELLLLDGRLFERHTKPLLDEVGASRGRIWFFRDATEDRRREAAQRLLAEAGEALASSLEDDARFDAVLDATLAWKADMTGLYVEENGAARLVGLRTSSPDTQAIGDEVLERFPLEERLSDPTRQAIESGRPVLLTEIPDELLREATGGGALLKLARRLRLGSAVVVPIRSGGQVRGGLAVGLQIGDRRYDESDVEVLEALADRIAVAFDNSRLYRERDFVARSLQQGLLPTEIPHIPGLALAARYRAAGEGNEVGGDFYDVFEVREGVWGVAVGDVCGKGPTAAALTGVVRHTMRAAALRDDRPSAVLALVNQAILRASPEDRFCTLAFGRIHRSGDGVEVRLSLGGHPAPILLRPDGTTEEIHEPGALLGLFPDPYLSETTVALAPGDTLVMYTDGVTDEQRDGEEFGVERLHRLLRSSAGLPPDRIAERIERAVEDFSAGPPRDDVAVLIVRTTA
jgi:PAS domain S-box-containing protein